MPDLFISFGLQHQLELQAIISRTVRPAILGHPSHTSHQTRVNYSFKTVAISHTTLGFTFGYSPKGLGGSKEGTQSQPIRRGSFSRLPLHRPLLPLEVRASFRFAPLGSPSSNPRPTLVHSQHWCITYGVTGRASVPGCGGAPASGMGHLQRR